MLKRFVRTCRIVCFSDDDRRNVVMESYGAPFELAGSWSCDDSDKIPTLLVGWENVRKIYPKQNILVGRISDRVCWAHSKSEDESSFRKSLREFLKKSIASFFDVQYRSYDRLLDGDFKKFVERIMRGGKTYVYFSGKAMYVYDGIFEFGFNLESIRYYGEPVRELVTEFLSRPECITMSMSNFCNYVKPSFLKRYLSFENAVWVKYGEHVTERDFFALFDKMDIRRHIPYLMSMVPLDLSKDERMSCNRQCVKDVVAYWLSSQDVFFNGKYENDKLKATVESGRKRVRFSYSDKSSITGRIYCTEGNFNPQTLPKKGEERKMIVSRFDDGFIATFDYVSFETRLSVYMTENREFMEKYLDSDMHEEVARIVFGDGKKFRDKAKAVNHALLYGCGDEKLETMLSEVVENAKEALSATKEFWKPVLKKALKVEAMYEKLGYVVNPFGTLVRTTKKWGAFNNYVSSTAADIVADKILELRDFLSEKKSKLMFQVFDSFVFDIHPSEKYLMDDISELLSKFGKMKFKVSVKTGKTLADCS